MKTERTVFSASAVLFVLYVCLGTVYAQPTQPYFIDDFEDGDVHDGDPVNWLPSLPVIGEGRRVVDGSYVLTPASGTGVIADYAEGRNFDNVSVETQVRFLRRPGVTAAIGVSARGNNSELDGNVEWSGYWAGIVANSGLLQLGRVIEGNSEVLRETAFSPPPFTTDVHLQFDLFGENLSVTAWPDGSPQPNEPQLRVRDKSVSRGELALWVAPSDGNLAPGAFRFFAAVPEPASFTLTLTGLLALLILRRR